MQQFISRFCLPLGLAATVLAGCQSAPLPAALVQPQVSSQKSDDYEPQRVAVEELRTRQLNGEPMVIVDVRETVNYSDEHIAGALNLPWAIIQSGGFAPLPKDRLIALYCT